MVGTYHAEQCAFRAAGRGLLVALYTEQEFAEKVEWEGGVWEALTEYGLGAKDVVPGALRDFLENAEPLLAEASTEINAIEAYLESLEEPDED